MAFKKTTSLPTAAATFLALSASASLFAQTTDTTLPTVSVKGKADRPEDTGYQAEKTRVGKTTQLPKDVPQALTIVTRQFIEDTNATTLKEALRNVSGLTFNAAEGGRTGDNMNLRGFYSFGDIYLDGIRDVAQIKRDTFNDQQIEVLRGSAAMLFGHGQAGGVINRVSKVPMMLDTGSVTATVGDTGYNRVTADVNKPVGDSTAVRINVMNTAGGETTRDHVNVNRRGLAASLRTGIGTDDELVLNHYHMEVKDTPDYGVPFKNGAPLNVDKNRFYGTDKDFEINNVDMTTGTYTHRFDADRELRSTLRIADYKRRLWTTVPRLNAAGTLVNRNVSARGADEWTITSQTDYTQRVTIGGMKHEFLAGVELLKEQARRCSYGTTTPLAPVSVDAAPNYSISTYTGRPCNVYTGGYAGNSAAIYGQDVIEFSPGWKALFGIRRDSLDADIQNAAGGLATTRGNLRYMENSYRAALSWQPNDEAHYYVGWSDSFNPTADLYQFTNTQNVYRAERSKTYELGAKWELFEGDLSLRSSLYRAEKDWERNTDVETAGLGQILSIKRHTDGLELEAAGRINPRWEVFGGLALMRATIDEHFNANLVGKRPRNTPPWTYSLWSTYRLDGGWRVGAGVEGKGVRQGFGANSTTTVPVTPNYAPSYHRLDTMLAYEQSSYSVRLNLFNLTNRTYYESIYENGAHTVPGTGRAAQLTVEYKY